MGAQTSHAPAAWAPGYPQRDPRDQVRQPPVTPRPALRRPVQDGAARRGAARRRLAALLLAAVSSTAVVTAAAVLPGHSHTPHGAASAWSGAAAQSRPSMTTIMAATGQGARPGALVLTARDYRLCPPPATACVDLTRHLTWLQSGGLVTFGPVRMEPGPPGSAHATPRGTFHVAWKAGPGYISTIYHDPMPWAVFFAAGGIAFHAGSLTIPSHGCVHLTLANAHYYNENLPVGAEVVVF